MRARGIADAVDRVDRRVDGRIKADRVVGTGDIVIDGAGTPMTGNPVSASMRLAPVNDPSPPMTTSPFDAAPAQDFGGLFAHSFFVKFLQRSVFKMVPPRCKILATNGGPSAETALRSGRCSPF